MMKSLLRKVALKGNGIMVEDCLSTSDREVDMVWNMTTEAQSFIRKGSKLILTAKRGERLEMKVRSKLPFKAELVPATPLNSFEGQNEGISFLRLHYTVPSQKEDNIFSVSLKPLK